MNDYAEYENEKHQYEEDYEEARDAKPEITFVFDEKALKQLERYTDPTQLWRKITNQEKVIRSRREALSDAPGQVILTSPIAPAGKLPAGWTMVEL